MSLVPRARTCSTAPGRDVTGHQHSDSKAAADHPPRAADAAAGVLVANRGSRCPLGQYQHPTFEGDRGCPYPVLRSAAADGADLCPVLKVRAFVDWPATPERVPRGMPSPVPYQRAAVHEKSLARDAPDRVHGVVHRVDDHHDVDGELVLFL